MLDTVLIALNVEQVGILRLEGGQIGHRVAEAVQMWPARGQHPSALDFGYGRVVWQGPADQAHVVIVGKAGGVRVGEATNVDPSALSEMAECLSRHGYAVAKSKT